LDGLLWECDGTERERERGVKGFNRVKGVLRGKGEKGGKMCLHQKQRNFPVLGNLKAAYSDFDRRDN